MFSVVNWSFAFRVYAMMIDNEGNLYREFASLETHASIMAIQNPPDNIVEEQVRTLKHRHSQP